MTAYNREPFIGAAIESVLAQTMPDFELVIVDDRSSDGTMDVARRYAHDPRVKVIQNERNLGDYQNRNHALTLARGEYVKYHDSDDVMYPHCLQVMVEGLDAVPDAGIAMSSSRGWSGAPCPMRLTPELCYRREFLGTGMFHGGPASALFRTRTLRQLGGFPLFGGASDYVFWLRACATTTVALVSGDLFWYRLHAGQELTSAKAHMDYAVAAGEAWRMLNSPACPLDPRDLARARRNCAFGIARVAARYARAGRLIPAWATIRRSGLTPADWIRYLRLPRRAADAGTPPDVIAGECGPVAKHAPSSR
jgi:glycosyltransferase involved in cell wall biosynthesis